MSLELSGLDGKVAVVSGAARYLSIGRYISLELAKAGCDVVVFDLESARGPQNPGEVEIGWKGSESIAEEITSLGRRSEVFVADISDENQVIELSDSVFGRFGRVDVLVNNAAQFVGEDRVAVVDLSAKAWQKVMDVNLTGTFYMSREFAKKILAGERGGSIVNISSLAAKTAPANRAAYAVSKAGINTLTASMAKELGPAGIRVNSLCPFMVLPTHRGYSSKRSNPDIYNEERDERIASGLPLRRVSTGIDTAWLVTYLCSDQGSYITGQQWNVDGGGMTVH